MNRIPHIAALMVDNIAEVLKHGDTIVIGNKDQEFHGVLEDLQNGQCAVDMARIAGSASRSRSDECII